MTQSIERHLGRAATMTADEYIAAYGGSPRPHRIVIGAAIAGPSNDKPSVLIVQRSAHERSYPNEWEIPGGHVDPGELISKTVVREVLEETSLVVTKIIGAFAGFDYRSTKYEEDESEDKDDTTYSICTRQLNYCVEVQNTSAVKLNPDEHQNYAWCTVDTIEQFEMTPAMSKVVRDALDALSRFKE
ncbi:hypothetical protein IW140_005899 [Coemansia sp. RSA 1813]|nr:hypothetical protein EV178_005888 [Coemansia sp. RSA 1646]KAJ1767645.1 hypothetical protein LPJ74_005254 [Coemansia sp. RSA 1843]KAJ2086253.1 hypothetical protein IW138_005810 [Coemansia sp. RSA 986]KAJ2210923.1 hypothetical protein EV179_005881 [Coemansia sp. RSA 487]KAJ2564015.1 hypothetical protein IW140_005899 [Coemansia sp. RSA 1813]